MQTESWISPERDYVGASQQLNSQFLSQFYSLQYLCVFTFLICDVSGSSVFRKHVVLRFPCLQFGFTDIPVPRIRCLANVVDIHTRVLNYQGGGEISSVFRKLSVQLR